MVDRWREGFHEETVYLLFEALKLKKTYQEIREGFPKLKVVMFSPEFYLRAHATYRKLVDRLEEFGMGCFKGEKPMSGFYGVFFALGVCEETRLYGFDSWTDEMTRKGSAPFRYHYFDDEEPR